MFILTLFIYWFYIIAHASLALATEYTPLYNNQTALHEDYAPMWVDEPLKRGTWRILYSCVFTLSLCVYKSIHLNVPSMNEGQWKPFLRKVIWVIIAILVPEIVLFNALEQYQQARYFKKWANARIEKKPGISKKHKKITMMQAFYITMGGLVVEVPESRNLNSSDTGSSNDTRPKDLEKQQPRRFPVGHFVDFPDEESELNKEGEIDLLIDLIPTVDTIDNKSKVDILGKLIILLQVISAVAEAIARGIKQYPLTILEIHTLAHIACALASYIIWFHKPNDIRDPTIFTGQIAAQIGRLESIQKTSTDNNVLDLHYGFSLVNACALYGIVHLSTWNFEFPTATEKLLWRIMCIFTVIGAYAFHIDTTRIYKAYCRKYAIKRCEYIVQISGIDKFNRDGTQVCKDERGGLNTEGEAEEATGEAEGGGEGVVKGGVQEVLEGELEIGVQGGLEAELKIGLKAGVQEVVQEEVQGGVQEEVHGGEGGNEKSPKPQCLPVNTAASRWETFKEMFTGPKDEKTGIMWKIRVILSITLTSIYVLVRLFITAESFISLRRTQSGAYATVKYSDLVPHF